MKKLALFFLFFHAITFAQTKYLQKDTSYTTNSTYKKLIGNYPFIKIVKPILPDSVNASREITYCNYGDRELKLDIFFKQPKNVKQPAIILIHGGGWKTGNKSLMFPLALELAKRNFVTLTVEYRLSPEAIFPAALRDINNAIKWTKQNAGNFNIDSSKIVLLGCSAGAQIATLVGFENQELDFQDSIKFLGISTNVSAIVNIDGVIDFLGNGSEEFDEFPDPNRPRAAHLWFGASQIERPDLWKKASAINYINNNSCPIIFINSSFPRFHAGRDEAITLLKKYNVYFEVHTLENSPHSYWLFHPWFEKTVSYIENFLNKLF
jgi:pectinesterase